MADGISLRVLTSDVTKAFAAVNVATDRATMYTVRQAARKVGQYARKAAPVYTGPARDRYVGGTNVGPMGKGDLKKSIHSAKRLSRVAGGYGVTVGPRGIPAVYAAAQEARTPYMGPAKDQVSSEILGIASVAWGRAARRL